MEELVGELFAATKSGALKWETMSIAGHYVTFLGSKAVCLGKLPDDDERIYYSVLNADDGKVIYKLVFASQDGLYGKLNDLYSLAQLNDVRIKNITDNLISDLKNMVGISYSSLKEEASVAE